MAELKSQRVEIIGRLDGIDTKLEQVTTQVNTLENALNQTNAELGAQKTRVEEAEARISRLEDSLYAAERTIDDAHKAIETLKASALKEITALQSKTDDLENRGGRI